MAEVAAELSALFSETAAEALTPLCLNKAKWPLGFDHPALLTELAGVHLGEGETEHFRFAYVFISAYYFLLDAVADGHAQEAMHVVKLTQLITAFWVELDKGWNKSERAIKERRNNIVSEYVTRNADGMILEKKLQGDPLGCDDFLDRQTAVARGNSFPLFYEIICIYRDIPARAEVLDVLRELVCTVQMSDDLVDWEEDYAHGRWTPILRQCFQRAARILSFNELQEVIYLSGVFEERVAVTINKLTELSTQLKSFKDISSSRLQIFIKIHRGHLLQVLREAVTLKLSVRKSEAQ